MIQIKLKTLAVMFPLKPVIFQCPNETLTNTQTHTHNYHCVKNLGPKINRKEPQHHPQAPCKHAKRNPGGKLLPCLIAKS